MEGEPTEAKDKRAQIEGVPHHQGNSSLYQLGWNWVMWFASLLMQFIHHASLSPLITNLLCFSLSGMLQKDV